MTKGNFHDECKGCKKPIADISEAVNYRSWWYHRTLCWGEALAKIEFAKNKKI